LKVLVDVAISKDSSEVFHKRIAQLFGRITNKITNNPSLWNLYARFHKEGGDNEKAFEAHLRAYRALQTSGWEKDLVSVEQIAKVCLDIVTFSESIGKREKFIQVKMLLQNLILRIKDYFSNHIFYEQLTQALENIEKKLKDLNHA
jgi:RNAse (barnase) inhibitor barstar